MLHMSLFKSLNLIGCQIDLKVNVEKIFKCFLLRNHIWDESDTLYIYVNEIGLNINCFFIVAHWLSLIW